jgi:hypothetical protein
VLSGAAMAVASTQKELQDFLKNAGEVSHSFNPTTYTLLSVSSFNCAHCVCICYVAQLCRLYCCRLYSSMCMIDRMC